MAVCVRHVRGGGDRGGRVGRVLPGVAAPGAWGGGAAGRRPPAGRGVAGGGGTGESGDREELPAELADRGVPAGVGGVFRKGRPGGRDAVLVSASGGAAGDGKGMAEGGEETGAARGGAVGGARGGEHRRVAGEGDAERRWSGGCAGVLRGNGGLFRIADCGLRIEKKSEVRRDVRSGRGAAGGTPMCEGGNPDGADSGVGWVADPDRWGRLVGAGGRRAFQSGGDLRVGPARRHANGGGPGAGGGDSPGAGGRRFRSRGP